MGQRLPEVGWKDSSSRGRQTQSLFLGQKSKSMLTKQMVQRGDRRMTNDN